MTGGTLPSGGSDDEPGPAVGREVVLEPVHRARRARKLAQSRRTLDGLLLTLLRQLLELGLREILEAAAGEFLGPLERNAALVAVVVGAGDIRVAPRRPRRLVGAARRDRRGRFLGGTSSP